MIRIGNTLVVMDYLVFLFFHIKLVEILRIENFIMLFVLHASILSVTYLSTFFIMENILNML